jgi:hypothetical protein
MRSTLILLMLLFPALGIANAIWFGSELQRFAASTTAIASTIDIERLKEVVARQMYAALVQIVLLAAPTVVFFYGLFRGVLEVSDVVYIILPSAVVIVLASIYKKVESRVRTMSVTDDELRRQRDAIVETWVKRPLPDW